MNITETGITINPLPILIAVGAISFGVVVGLIITKFRRRRHIIKILAIQKKAMESEQKKAMESEENEKLFPHPWIIAYDKCCTANSYSGRRLWFEKWIKNQPALPSISLKAVEKFRRILASEERQNETWISAIAFFAPYIDTGVKPKPDSRHGIVNINRDDVCHCDECRIARKERDWYPKDGEISPEYCKQHLPPKWYELVKLFKSVWVKGSFSSDLRRSEFLDRIKEIKEKNLVPSETKLLAQVFGEGDLGGSDFYAAHIKQFEKKVVECDCIHCRLSG